MKTNINRIIIFGLLVAVASSCMLGPKFQQPSVESPAKFRYDSLMADSTLNVAWWEIFQSQELDTLVKLAIANNKDALMAASRIEEARSYLGFTKADLYPSIGYGGEANIVDSYKTIDVDGNRSTAEDYFLAPSLSWELDFWGKYRRANEAARAQMLATEHAQKWMLVNLIAEVASTYYAYLDFSQRLETSERTLQTRQASLNIIQQRFDKGTVPEIDLNQAQIQEAIAATAVPIYRRQKAITEHSLSILIGQNPRPVLVTESLNDQILPPDIPAGIPSMLLQRRPDVLQAEQLLKAQNAQIGIAQAMRFPSISLTGFFGVASADLDNLLSTDTWGVSGSVLGPIFNFGKNKKRVEIERYRTEQALLAYEQKVLMAFKDVEDALITVHSYKEEVNARNKQMAAATNAAMLSQKRYDGGVTSYLEVLDSERSMFEAELAASQSLKNQFDAYIMLYKALGGGWILPEDKPMVQSQAINNETE